VKRVALSLAIAALIAYLSNFVLLPGGDAAPHVLTAGSWVIQGNADMDEYASAMPRGQLINGHIYSIYPPGTATVIAVPVWIAIALGAQIDSPEFIAVFGKLAAALLVALSVGLVYLACAAIVRPIPALVATIAYGFGTSVWAISSQHIWEHAPSHFFVALGTYLITRPPRTAALGALAYGFATVVRPTEAVMAAFGAVVSWRQRMLVRYLAWGVPAVVFLLVYTYLVFGTIRPTYPDSDLPWTFPPPGWLGLLVSPSRGLFVYSPVLLFAVAGFVMAWRERENAAVRLVRYAGFAVLANYGVYALIGYWWGGWSFGNRYLSDVGALFAVGIAFAIDRGLTRTRLWRTAFVATLAWSVFLEFVGAGWYHTLWNGYHWDVTPDIDVTTYRLWDWTDPQWWFVMRHMALDPGWTILPTTVGALLAAFLVWRSHAALRRARHAPAEHEEVVQTELKALVH
jgi:hypothetical protein